MPVVAKDVDVWPEGLLQEDLGAERRWFALYTRPRQDKTLMRHLLSMRKAFCGLLVPTRKRMPSGGLKTSYLPLFPNYVFLHGTDQDRYDSLTTNCVQTVLDVTDGSQLQKELGALHEAILSGRSVSTVDKIQEGQSVRIVSGPLAGHEGVLIQRRGNKRIVLSLSFLQQGAAVEIDDASIERS